MTGMGILVWLSASAFAAEVEIASPCQDGFVLPFSEVRGFVKAPATEVRVYVRKQTPYVPANPHPDLWVTCACNPLPDRNGVWRTHCPFPDPRDEARSYELIAIWPKRAGLAACRIGGQITPEHLSEISEVRSDIVYVSGVTLPSVASRSWWHELWERWLGGLIGLLAPLLWSRRVRQRVVALLKRSWRIVFR